MENYSSQDMAEFRKMVEEVQQKVTINPEEAARKFIKMYARPVENSIIAAEVFRS